MRHFQSKYDYLNNKSMEFFYRKLTEFFISKQILATVSEMNEKLLQVSCNVYLKIAKAGKPKPIGVYLLLPATEELFCGEKNS